MNLVLVPMGVDAVLQTAAKALEATYDTEMMWPVSNSYRQQHWRGVEYYKSRG